MQKKKSLYTKFVQLSQENAIGPVQFLQKHEDNTPKIP